MITLDPSQAQAVNNITAAKQRLNLLIGGAGAGKTTTIKQVLETSWADAGSGITPYNTYLAAPTGKAAKVMTDTLAEADFVVENPPRTIHRLLEFNPREGFGRNSDNTLHAALVILDEASMIDSALLAHVIHALPKHCRLVLVGDENQLEPVGPGQPFTDIRTYGAPDAINRLTMNHRQRQGSLIANGCIDILAGNIPTFGKPGEKTLGGELYDDLFYHELEEKEDIPELVGNLCAEWHQQGADYAVLAPQKTGVCGVDALNKYLQDRLNPAVGQGQLKLGWLTLREGDRVLQTRNNYDLGVFNGFTGVITQIDTIGSSVTVDFLDQEIVYEENGHIKDLALGYALSIHKSQGSQMQHGVVVLHSSHYYMLSRSLTYTAFSRFKKSLHVIGNAKALKRGVSNIVSGERNTYLKLQMGGEI